MSLDNLLYCLASFMSFLLSTENNLMPAIIPIIRFIAMVTENNSGSSIDNIKWMYNRYEERRITVIPVLVM